MEILRVYAAEYVQLAVKLDVAMYSLEKRDIWQDEQLQGLLDRHMQSFGEVCVACDLAVTRILVDKVLFALRDKARTVDSALLTEYLKQLRVTFTTELDTKLFLQVPSNKMRHFDSPCKGWEKVVERFADTLSEIEEMGKCFALSRYGAAVFHSLLVVESGLIDLGKAIGVTDQKVGWDATTRKLNDLVQAGHSKYPLSLAINFATCEQINQKVQTMKHAWRNKVNHVAGRLVVIRSDFAPDVAEEIIIATRGFMRTLATDIPGPVTAS